MSIIYAAQSDILGLLAHESAMLPVYIILGAVGLWAIEAGWTLIFNALGQKQRDS